MIATENTQSIATFQATVAETLDRINQTGEPEFITVDGEPRGVLLAPAAYETLARDSGFDRRPKLDLTNAKAAEIRPAAIEREPTK